MIEIDLNVRINGNHTFAYIDYNSWASRWGDIQPGDAIVVYETETHMHYPASVVEMVDTEQRPNNMYVELDVAWQKGKFV